jgi:uncharacterized membrane protein YkoI
MEHRFLTTLLFGAIALSAAEKTVPEKDLPPAVQKAVQEQSAGATIKGFAQEIENGATTYEVEMIVNGHGKDVSFDPAGKVVGVEEEVVLDKVPAQVKAAIERAAEGGKIKKVEKVTEGGTTSFEAAYTKAGKSHEIAVKPDGSPVKAK